MTRTRQRWPLAGSLMICAVALLLIVMLGRLGIDPLLDQLAQLEMLVQGRFWLALTSFALAFVILAMLALPVGTLFCLAGGYLFGIWLGAGAALLGASLAAVLTMVLVRRFGGHRLRRYVATSRIEPWVTRLEADADWYVLLSRIVPVAPFFVVNAAAGMSNIRIGRFALVSTLGLIPVTVIYAAVGNGLGSVLEAREMMGASLLLEPQIGLPLLALAALVVASWFLKRWSNGS